MRDDGAGERQARAERVAVAWADAQGRDVTTTVSGALWWCSEGEAPKVIARLHGSTVARIVDHGAGPEVIAREVVLVDPLVRALLPTAVVIDPMRLAASESDGALLDDDTVSHALRVPADAVALLSPEGRSLEPTVEVVGGWDRAVRWAGDEISWSQLTPQVLPMRPRRTPITEGLLLWQVTGSRQQPGRRVPPDALRSFVRDVRPELAYAPTEQAGSASLAGLPGTAGAARIRRRRGGR